MSATRPKIVILGAGFGGLWAARRLGGVKADVTLIDRNNFHTFLPLLYQVGAAELEPFAIARPVRTLIRGQTNLHFLNASVRRVDLAGKLVHTSHGVHGYDWLIVALGTVPWDFGVPGARRHAFPLKTLEDGVALRSHILSRFELAMHEPDATRRRHLLHFVVVGGGPTGVEFAGALSELVRGPLARDYPAVASEPRITLLEASDRLLGGMSDALGRYAVRRLERMGIEVRMGAKVMEVTPTGVRVAGGDPAAAAPPTIVADTVAWTAGVRGPTEIGAWGLPTVRDGRVPVLPTLQLANRPEVFAVGDIVSGSDEGGPWPMLAQFAMQGGVHAARSIEALLNGDAPRPFRYRDRGLMAVIGRNAAVASVWGRDFKGFLAWVLWVVIHLYYLIGFRNRFAVMLNWAWDYVFFERVARILLPFRRHAPAWPSEGPGLPGPPDGERHAEIAGSPGREIALDVDE